MNEYNIHLDDKAVDELKGAIGGGGTTVVPNPELVGDEDNLTGLEVDGVKYKVPQGSGIEYVELNSASGTIEVETFQKLDFGGAYIKYNDIVLIPNGREQSGGGLGGTKTCYFASTVNNNKYLSCVLTASLPLPPNATVPYTITEISVGGGIEFVDIEGKSGEFTQQEYTKLQNGAIIRKNGIELFFYAGAGDYLYYTATPNPSSTGDVLVIPSIEIDTTTLEWSFNSYEIAVIQP